MNMESQDRVIRNKHQGTIVQKYKKSFINALSGLRYAFLNEHNMIIILLAIIVTILMGTIYKISTFEWIFCITIIGCVTASELINSAIEATVDLITTNTHPLAKIAKDTASSATLILSITALIGALIIFIPKIFV